MCSLIRKPYYILIIYRKVSRHIWAITTPNARRAAQIIHREVRLEPTGLLRSLIGMYYMLFPFILRRTFNAERCSKICHCLSRQTGLFLLVSTGSNSVVTKLANIFQEKSTYIPCWENGIIKIQSWWNEWL